MTAHASNHIIQESGSPSGLHNEFQARTVARDKKNKQPNTNKNKQLK